MIIRDFRVEECHRLSQIDPSFSTSKVYRVHSEDGANSRLHEVELDQPLEVMPPMFGSTSSSAALRYRDLFEHYDLFLVAEEDDRLLGAVCAFPLRAALGEEAKFLSMPGEYLLTSLAVDRDHRGLGIGRALLDRVKAHCVDHRHSMVSLWTGFDYHPAIEFYRSQGFSISGWQHPPGCKFDQCRVYMTWVP